MSDTVRAETGDPGLAWPALRSNLIDQITDTALSRPLDLAAVSGSDQLTWSSLEGRSNAGGSFLHHEFGPGAEPLAILGGDRLEEIVALLAVLKSGRPFVILDRSSPPHRITQVLELARPVGIIVADSHLEGLDPPNHRVIRLASVCGDTCASRPDVPAGPDDPVNIVFTSGSTGRPKGVVCSHRYYLGQAAAYLRRGYRSGDRVALVLPSTYAAGIIILLRSLVLGATLHSADLQASQTAGSLLQWIRSEAVEILEFTPSLLRSLLKVMGEGDVLDHLRIVECFGESLFAQDVADLRRHLPAGCSVRNTLGSSETGSTAAYRVPGPEVILAPGLVPVGQADFGVRISLIDAAGDAVTEGEIGEIAVTSDHIASGYWDDPELTALRFSRGVDGLVTYRSGDIGRFTPDGSLLHMGRGDRTVKIRGYLVEPAEVEGALRQTGLVHDVIVVADESPGRRQLIAYVVPVDTSRHSPAAMRMALRRLVPEQFIPSRIVSLPTLPHNSNEKIDRFQLPPAPDRDVGFVAPRTGWERAVAELWCEVLSLEEVGVEDDFFVSGGDSLAVEELIAAMAEKFGMTIGYADLTEASTLAAFAERARAGNVRRGMVVPLREGTSRSPLFCFSGAGGPAGVFLMLARHLGDDRPVYGLHAHGIEGGGIPDWSVRRWAARCLAEVRALQPIGPYQLAGHSLGSMVAWEVAHQLNAQGEEVSLVALIDTLTAAEPARRRGLLRTAADVARISAAGIWPRDRRRQIDLFFRHGQIISRRYRPQPWDGPTIVYRARSVPDDARRFDWAPFLEGPREEFELPGDHNSLLADPNVAELAAHLSSRLADPGLVR